MTAGVPAGRAPPFVLDYQVGDRRFGILLPGPLSWQDAEAHVAAIAATGAIVGSDAVELPARAIDAFSAGADALLQACAANGQIGEFVLISAAALVAGGVAGGPHFASIATAAAQIIEAGVKV